MHREQRRDLARIGFEARGVALGEVEEALHVLLLARRHLEERAEGLDLAACHVAVDPGHLGAERDHTDGEGDLAQARMVLGIGWRRDRRAGTALLDELVDGMPRHHAQQRRDRPAQREARGAPDDLSPDLHTCSLRDPGHRIKDPMATATNRPRASRR